MKNPGLFYATAAAAMAASLSHGYGVAAFSGNKRCKFCRKPTMSSQFCDLRCACAYKTKEKEANKA